MTAGILLVLAGYTIASYGVCLARGYDIPFKRWVDPMDPWRWPAGKVPVIPATQIWP